MNVLEQAVRAYQDAGGNISRAAIALGIPRSTLSGRIKRAGVSSKPIASGRADTLPIRVNKLPKRDEVTRYILTSAQNNTHVHPPVWENLKALADYFEADIYVGTFTYNKNAYSELSVKRGKSKTRETKLWYDPEILPHIVDERVELAPNLHWCGEMNILPTAVDPLNGFETYTHRSSGIFPSVKFAMRSIPGGTKNDSTKFNYTTGCVTQRNYVQKRAGLRAEHHHGYGGLIVEVNADGSWWVRQLNASTDGTIYDLDLVVEDGEVYQSDGVAAISWGDVHELMLDREVRDANWGHKGMLDTLRPRQQFIHDVLLGSVTNHWEAKNPHSKFRRFAQGGGFSSLEEELIQAGSFLEDIGRAFCETVVVDSNHDRPWIERWLQNPDGQDSPKNMILWHKLNAALLEAIQDDPHTAHPINVLQYAIQEIYDLANDVTFLKEDESRVVAGIECGQHGHLGPNGSRGTPRNLSKLGRRANVGHYHSAGIWDGLYAAGSSARLDLTYNSGPSSWSNSHVVTYPNGKRTVVTVWQGKWRA